MIKKQFLALATIILFLTFGVVTPSSAATVSASKINVLSSENVTQVVKNNQLKIYLNTFRPNMQVFFRLNINNTSATTLTVGSSKVKVPVNGTIGFSVQNGAFLDQNSLTNPVSTVKNPSGSDLVQIFSAPPTLPKISYSGDTKLIAGKQILSTPVVDNGTYAIASVGTQINFFIYSPSSLIGFRKIQDASALPSVGGSAVYAYLEQKDFTVTATSPGSWRLLDSEFNAIERINKVSTKYGTLYTEGHGMTTSPEGHAVVITTPTRKVDSTWLKRSYPLPILDCSIVEVIGGKALREFNFWDWAVANKSVIQPYLDSMSLQHDPQNPNSPIDICHANSLEYYKPLNVYLVSLRSPSIILILSADLGKVKSVIDAKSSLQHFARFNNQKNITAFGNYTFGKYSKFLDFKQVNGQWKLSEYNFPIHINFCANANYLDATHVWLGGGCNPAEPGMLGAIYQIKGSDLVEVGRVKLTQFKYSYRADLL